MKRTFLFLIVFIVTVLQSLVYAQAKPILAVLPFTGGQGEEGETLAELFSFNDRLNDVFDIIPRTRITQAVSQEHDFQRDTGMTDPRTIVLLGEQLGARYVVAGNITTVGNNKLLVISIIDISSLQQIAGDYRTYNNVMDIRGRLPVMADNIIQASRANTASLPKLAIIPVELHGDANQQTADTLTQILAINLIRSGKYSIYPRTENLQQIMEEYQMQSERTSFSNRTEPGRGENPDFVLSVIARRIENINMFNASIQNLTSGTQVVGRSVDYRDVNDGIRIMERLSVDLTSTEEQISQRNQAEAEERRRAQDREQRSAQMRAKWDNLFKDERRFWSVGANVGSMYGVPVAAGIGLNVAIGEFGGDALGFLVGLPLSLSITALSVLAVADGYVESSPYFSPAITGNLNTTLAPFPYSFIELGCDALFVNPNGVQGSEYISFYPYANYLFFVSSDYKKGGIFLGLGTGRMFTVKGSAEREGSSDRIKLDDVDLIHDRFALNTVLGAKMGRKPHYFDVRAIAGFDFNGGVYYTMLCGYSFRFTK